MNIQQDILKPILIKHMKANTPEGITIGDEELEAFLQTEQSKILFDLLETVYNTGKEEYKDFTKWHSGMNEEQLGRAMERFKREVGN